ncbi:MAG: recombination protein RecR [Calditrichaeota bacterium]|nr:recombination protein RecR [Candidatus Cloacimonadota bacterium]MCA9787639.1 recombination protein RecR [Candidatus Cloacimonadota bacterium]MCB1046567.1 recombination protein RecR [Calditrichota bacterium]MCB9474771.1 recombination protein RecR [Candidatus Delongbacteria bacterium]
MEALVAEFAKLPGIGRKTALRLALHSLMKGQEGAGALATALQRVLESSRFCEDCGNLSEQPRCDLCLNPRRDRTLICVVEHLQDLMAVERAGEYRGLYHILGGALSPLDGVGPGQLSIRRLGERLATGEVQELILATNSTVEGDATALYLQREFQELPIRLSRLARGVPMGGSLDFIDTLTLARALDGRESLR